jgi:hypothetical protein
MTIQPEFIEHLFDELASTIYRGKRFLLGQKWWGRYLDT